MTDELPVSESLALEEAVAQLEHAAAARKCWACGCLHGTLDTIERVLAVPHRPAALEAAIATARAHLTVRYDCLGCDVCFPAVAVNAIHESHGEPPSVEACPTAPVEARAGWPPLPGDYTALRYKAPVAVCTLTDDGLAAAIAREAAPSVAIVGALQTENLGIERVITNSVTNPNIRFLVVAGTDSRQAIGHLPGQSLVALAWEGIDTNGRIVGARGKRPVLRNTPPEMVDHFRRTVEVIDLVGTVDIATVMTAIRDCAARSRGPSQPFGFESVLTSVLGYLPVRTFPDPTGYFVIYVDRLQHRLSLEHYRKDGLLDTTIEGLTAAEVYIPAIERGLLSRLDHAAYLGRELARAERALQANEPYVQDGAPEGAGSPLPTETRCWGTDGAHGTRTEST